MKQNRRTLHYISAWGAQAGLYYHYGLQKRQLRKNLGVYEHTVLKRNSPISGDLTIRLCAAFPLDRNSTGGDPESARLGADGCVRGRRGCLREKRKSGSQFFVMGHRNMTAIRCQKYFRDVEAGKEIHVPGHCFPHDDPRQSPVVRWRSAALTKPTGWCYVYQTTPTTWSQGTEAGPEAQKGCGGFSE